MSNLVQVFLHPGISGFQLSLDLAYHQPWIREKLSCFSPQFLDHDHPYQQSFIFPFIVRSQETQSQRFFNRDPLWGCQDQIHCSSLLRHHRLSKINALIQRLLQPIFHQCFPPHLSFPLRFQWTRLLNRQGPTPWPMYEAYTWCQKPLEYALLCYSPCVINTPK